MPQRLAGIGVDRVEAVMFRGDEERVVNASFRDG